MQYERRWLAVIALGLSLLLSALDATIVALALPPIAQHFQLSDRLASAHRRELGVTTFFPSIFPAKQQGIHARNVK